MRLWWSVRGNRMTGVPATGMTATTLWRVPPASCTRVVADGASTPWHHPPVHVGGGIHRQLQIDHQIDSVKVDAPCHQVSGDRHPQPGSRKEHQSTCVKRVQLGGRQRVESWQSRCCRQASSVGARLLRPTALCRCQPACVTQTSQPLKPPPEVAHRVERLDALQLGALRRKVGSGVAGSQQPLCHLLRVCRCTRVGGESRHVKARRQRIRQCYSRQGCGFLARIRDWPELPQAGCSPTTARPVPWESAARRRTCLVLAEHHGLLEADGGQQVQQGRQPGLKVRAKAALRRRRRLLG